MLYKTQGIIIKKSNLGEIDRLLAVYTRDFGKILLKAKSVRKNQSKLKGHLELFLHTHLMIAPGRGFDIITSAETIEQFPYLRQNLPCLATAYYLTELTDRLMAGPEKDEDIWQLLLDSFQKLNQSANVKTVREDFETKLLELLGYGKNQKKAYLFIRSLLGGEIKSRSFLSVF